MLSNYKICKLTKHFHNDFPSKKYPEMLIKPNRPYLCLIVKLHENTYLCIPYRSDIKHKNSYLFKNSHRSKKSSSGLDYSKMLILNNLDYLSYGIIDNDEHKETMQNINIITKKVIRYIKTYKDHISNIKPLSYQAYNRHYKFSTLPYFDSVIMDLEL